MKKYKRGFTLIEVVLFVGLTAALFAGIAAGVGNSVYQQRYSDAVQNYAEFLRTVYSQVSNVQNESSGRSNKAIYGKVMTFRAEKIGDDGKTEGNVIKTYNLVGDLEMVTVSGDVGSGMDASRNATCRDTGAVIARLNCLEANVLVEEVDEDGFATGKYKPVGFTAEYKPRWDSEVQTTNEWSNGYQVFEGIVIIARSPTSGNVSTYVWAPKDDTSQLKTVRKIIDSIESCTQDGMSCANDGDIFRTKAGKTYSDPDGYETYMSTQYFKVMDMDFCLNPAGAQRSSIRRDIRVVKGAHNASGINVLDEDQVTAESELNYTNKDQNRCQ